MLPQVANYVDMDCVNFTDGFYHKSSSLMKVVYKSNLSSRRQQHWLRLVVNYIYINTYHKGCSFSKKFKLRSHSRRIELTLIRVGGQLHRHSSQRALVKLLKEMWIQATIDNEQIMWLSMTYVGLNMFIFVCLHEAFYSYDSYFLNTHRITFKICIYFFPLTFNLSKCKVCYSSKTLNNWVFKI